MVTLNVGVLPGRLQSIVVEDGSTVEDAIDAAGFEMEGYSITRNNTSASADDRVENNDTVILAKRINAGK